jgi:hypothetical protein
MMDNMHILNTCDSFPPVNSAAASCVPVVTHGDGTLVTAASPAKAGEEIVIWAFGLGRTQIPVQTGTAAPPNASIGFPECCYWVLFDLSTNAAPKNPGYANQSESYPIETVYSGLTAGYVGLYQINLTLPKGLVTHFACGKTFHSNLTIDMGLISSFDGAPICIEATQ